MLAWGDKTIDFTPPFERKTYDELFTEILGIDATDPAAVADVAKAAGLETVGRHPDVIKSEVFEARIEKALVGPIFVCDYPASICPLTSARQITRPLPSDSSCWFMAWKSPTRTPS